MKKLLFGLLVGCVFAGLASGGIFVFNAGSPTLITTGPETGDYLWQYEIDMLPEQELTPASQTAPYTNANTGAYFTIYDFLGYVSGSISVTGASAGLWATQVQLTGITPPADVGTLTDSPSIENLTFVYTGHAVLSHRYWHLQRDFAVRHC